LQGPTCLPLPLPDGFHWGDDLLVDQSSGDIDPDAGFSKSIRLLTDEIIEAGLISKCSFKPREILLFGFGQGGMTALGTTKEFKTELGGAISIGGRIPSSCMLVNRPKRPPLCCCLVDPKNRWHWGTPLEAQKEPSSMWNITSGRKLMTACSKPGRRLCL
jgi:hypothetical protein